MNDPMLQNYMIQEIRQRHRNNECFQKIIAEFYEWKISEMDINCFISADSMQERTTWGEIDLEKDFGVCFKYRDMMYKAYDNCERFKVNKAWISQDQFIKVL